MVEAAPVAVETLVRVMESSRSGMAAVAAAKEVLERAMYQAAGKLHEADDEAGLFTFDSGLHERQGFTADVAKLQAALSDFEPFGTTSLYDATASTATRWDCADSSRRGGTCASASSVR